MQASKNKLSKSWLSTRIGLRSHHFETPVAVRSPKLNNVGPGQYVDGWWREIPGAACQECADGVRDNGPGWEIGEPCCHSARVRYILLRAYIIEKRMDPPLRPSAMGLLLGLVSGNHYHLQNSFFQSKTHFWPEITRYKLIIRKKQSICFIFFSFGFYPFLLDLIFTAIFSCVVSFSIFYK